MKTDAVNDLFRAFADATRLRLLHLLRAGEVCVGDLVAVLDQPQPTVSRHLKNLRDARLVTVRREGRFLHYSLAAPTNGFHAMLVECLGGCFREVPQLVADEKRLQRLQRETGCCARVPQPTTTPTDRRMRCVDPDETKGTKRKNHGCNT